MAGMLGWMGDALGLTEDEPATNIQVEPDHIDGAALEETVITPDDMVSKEHLYDIFASFKAAVDSEEGKARLALAVKQGQAVEDVTSQMQQEVATKLGLDGAATVDKFKYVLKAYKDDEVLCEEFIKFCEAESLACDEAELGPEKLAIKLAALEIEEAKVKANAPAGPAITVPPSAKDHSKRPALAPSAAAGGEGPVHPAQLKQLELLLAPAKDFEDMIKNMEFSMAKMMKQKPEFVEVMKAQLRARGVADAGSDPVAASITQVREAHDELREEFERMAAEQGRPYRDVVTERVTSLQARMAAAGTPMPGVPPSPSGGQAAAAAGGGLRFAVGTAIEARVTPDGKYMPGKITGQNVPGGPMGMPMPYAITLDSGQEVCAPFDTNFFVRPAGSTDMGVPPDGMQMPQAPGAAAPMRFSPGQRVECRITPEGQYAAGTVTQIHVQQPQGVLPYQIQLDSGQLIAAPQDTDFFIRAASGAGLTPSGAMGQPRMQQPGMQTRQPGASGPGPGGPGGPSPGGSAIEFKRPIKGEPLRFGPGEAVECRVTPEGQFAPGVVQALWYREDHFPEDVYMPYQIKLDNGMMIFAPADADEIIRKA